MVEIEASGSLASCSCSLAPAGGSSCSFSLQGALIRSAFLLQLLL